MRFFVWEILYFASQAAVAIMDAVTDRVEKKKHYNVAGKIDFPFYVYTVKSYEKQIQV